MFELIELSSGQSIKWPDMGGTFRFPNKVNIWPGKSFNFMARYHIMNEFDAGRNAAWYSGYYVRRINNAN